MMHIEDTKYYPPVNEERIRHRMTNLLRWACQDERLKSTDLNVYESLINRAFCQLRARESDVVTATDAVLARWSFVPAGEVAESTERLCRFGYLLPYDFGYRVLHLLTLNEGGSE
jgi:hypothetical protein